MILEGIINKSDVNTGRGEEMKQSWEIALDKFVEKWKRKKEVVGMVVCGSYITGNPSKHSDIDLQILFDKKVKWRERGNEIIDGVLIEYFANPLPQNLKYFENDYSKRKKINIHMFLTGRVLFDKNGDIKTIIKKAREWDKKKFVKMGKIPFELTKYSIWDMKDNLEEVYDCDSGEFYFVYYNYLNELFKDYCNSLRYIDIPANKLRRFLVNDSDKKKYNVPDFPDKNFLEIFIKAISIKDKTEMMAEYTKITNYVLNKMGGFDIDGWKLRSKAGK